MRGYQELAEKLERKVNRTLDIKIRCLSKILNGWIKQNHMAVERICEMENAYEEITKNLKSKPYRI